MIPCKVSIEHLNAAAPMMPASAPLIVFDDVCVLCSGFVQWVVVRDHAHRFWFTSAQGSVGQAFYHELQLELANFETNLVVIDGVAYGKSDAFIEIATRLGGIWQMSAALRIVPRPLRSLLYDLIARNRYRLFGRRETCWLPSRDLTDQVI